MPLQAAVQAVPVRCMLFRDIDIVMTFIVEALFCRVCESRQNPFYNINRILTQPSHASELMCAAFAFVAE